MPRNLRDTPFSTDRLFVWAVGIVLVLGSLGIVACSIFQIPIPPQLQSITMVSLGAFVARITGRK